MEQQLKYYISKLVGKAKVILSEKIIGRINLKEKNNKKKHITYVTK